MQKEIATNAKNQKKKKKLEKYNSVANNYIKS